MVTDPVCGIEVDERNSEYQSQYGSQTYSFCSEQCKNEFERNPEYYARAAA